MPGGERDRRRRGRRDDPAEGPNPPERDSSRRGSSRGRRQPTPEKRAAGAPRSQQRGSAQRSEPEVAIPDDITGRELEPSVRRELRGLPPERATAVARHLVAAGYALDDDTESAYAHARAARRLAPRLAVVREAIAIAAYRTGRYDEALSEFRALRRLSGSNEHWPVMADCERGLGRPERALQMAKAPEVDTLGPAAKAEMLIVVAGARRDLGQVDAAIATLQVPDLRDPAKPWTARLRYAYADALRAAERTDEATEWLARAAAADQTGETPAADELGIAAEGDVGAPDDVQFLDQ